MYTNMVSWDKATRTQASREKYPITATCAQTSREKEESVLIIWTNSHMLNLSSCFGYWQCMWYQLKPHEGAFVELFLSVAICLVPVLGVSLFICCHTVEAAVSLETNMAAVFHFPLYTGKWWRKGRFPDTNLLEKTFASVLVTTGAFSRNLNKKSFWSQSGTRKSFHLSRRQLRSHWKWWRCMKTLNTLAERWKCVHSVGCHGVCLDESNCNLRLK